jgi:hypothetical protein
VGALRVVAGPCLGEGNEFVRDFREDVLLVVVAVDRDAQVVSIRHCSVLGVLADATPGDECRDDAHDAWLVPWRPWLQRQAVDTCLQIRTVEGGDLLGNAVDDHAPAPFGAPVQVVDLEGHG